MKLIQVKGNIWEFTPFQEIYEIDENEIPENFNIDLIKGIKDFNYGSTRLYADNKVRTKATAIIEIRPYINEFYTIYFDKKGYYCIVLKKKVYLKDIIENENNKK